MSFSKAKIKRFNDITVLTPPPTKYNVIATPGKKSSQIERFLRKFGSPPGSEINSVQSTPCFQTPTVPKKKKFLGLSTSKNKSYDIEALREKIVECSNKDAYIQELIEQIEELKGKECRTKTEAVEGMQNITEKYNNLEKEYEEIKIRERNLTTEVDTLKLQLENLHQELEKQNEEHKEISEETGRTHRQEIAEKDSKIKSLESENEDKKSELELLEKTILEKTEESRLLLQKLEDENASLKKEIQELHNINKTEFASLKKQLEEQTNKLNLQEENFEELNLLNEIQTKETIREIENCYNNKLQQQEQRYEEILKECQAISEYNIIQCEVEKGTIKKQLVQKSDAYRCLKMEYDDLVNQVKNQEVAIDEMTRALKENGQLLTNVDVDILAYEISIKSFKETIEVLKKRLLDSDRDVMQLKDELEATEDKVVSYESQINDLSNHLKDALKFNEELEMQNESAQKLVMEEVKMIEKALQQKIDHELSEIQEVLKSEIEKLQEDNRSLNEQIESLQVQLLKEIEEGAEVTKKYIDISGKYDELTQEFEENIQKLNEARKTSTLIEPFKEQLESYATEVKLLKNEGITGITKKFSNMLEEKHAAKIEEMLQITENGLKRQQKDLETKNNKLEQQLNKLKHENEELRKQSKSNKNSIVDKENLGSPLRNKQVVKSPAVLKSKN